MRKITRLFAMLLFVILCPSAIGEAAKLSINELQTLLDQSGTRASDTLKIDLSDYDLNNLEDPLIVRNGRINLFTNGRFSPKTGYMGHLLEVTSNTTAILDKEVYVSGNYAEMIFLEGGKLELNKGSVVGSATILSNEPLICTSDKVQAFNFFTLNGGTVYGGFKSRSWLIMNVNEGRLHFVETDLYVEQQIFLNLDKSYVDWYSCTNKENFAFPRISGIRNMAVYFSKEVPVDGVLGILQGNRKYTEEELSKIKPVYTENPSEEFNISCNPNWFVTISRKDKMTGAEWLQSEIDKIAETTNEGEILIPSEYSSIESPIVIPENTKITLKGSLYANIQESTESTNIFTIKSGGSLTMADGNFEVMSTYPGNIFCCNGDLNLESSLTVGLPYNVTTGYVITDLSANPIVTRSQINNPPYVNLSVKCNISTSKPLVYTPYGTVKLKIEGADISYVYNKSPFISKCYSVSIQNSQLTSHENCFNFIQTFGFSFENSIMIGNYNRSEELVSASYTSYKSGSISTYNLKVSSCYGHSGSVGFNGESSQKMDFSKCNFLTFSGSEIDIKPSGIVPPSQAMNINDKTLLWLSEPIPANSWKLGSDDWHGISKDTHFMTGSGDYMRTIVLWSKSTKKTATSGNEQSGYKITEADLNNLVFVDMPEDILPYYFKVDGSKGGIGVRKKVKSLDDLQDWLDKQGDNKGTEEDPLTPPIDDDLDLDKNLDIDDLQLLLDGYQNTGSNDRIEKHKINLKGGDICVRGGACLQLKDIILDGCHFSKEIYVEGKLIINANVSIGYFSERFIHLRPGGKIVIYGGSYKDCQNIIYNEGGELEIADGEYTPDNDGYGIKNIGGNITVNGGTYNGNSEDNYSNETGGKFTINGGCFKGGFTNQGQLIVRGGIFGGGNFPGIRNRGGKLWVFEGNFEDTEEFPGIDTDDEVIICGCTSISNIYWRKNAILRFTSNIITRIRIKIIIEQVENVLIAKGYDGYNLTENDMKMIEWDIPSGYMIDYRPYDGIYLVKNSSVSDIQTDNELEPDVPVYNMNGIKVGEWRERKYLPRGIYIVEGRKITL